MKIQQTNASHIPVLKTNIGRQPVTTKTGTGTNANGQPYAPAKGVVANPLARRPFGLK